MIANSGRLTEDSPACVQDAIAKLGIAGEDIVREKQAQVDTVLKLGYGHCGLTLSVPQRSATRSVGQLRGKRIATTYPLTLRRYLRSRKLRAEVIELSGAVELAPTLDVADAICDIISTGTIARVNGLRPLHTIFTSEAVLIANRDTLRDPQKKILVERLLIRISGSLQARGRRYMRIFSIASWCFSSTKESNWTK